MFWERGVGLLLKKAFLNFSKFSTSLGVGVRGFFDPLVSLSARRAASSVGGISSFMEITLVNRRCSESDLDVFGFRNLYIRAADLLRAAPGVADILLAAVVCGSCLDAMCED